MVTLTDPVRDEIAKELKQFRKGSGHPGPHRLNGLFHLTEALGDGIPEKAFDELSRLRHEYGVDPMTNIGAYFYLSGWDIGLGTIDERRARYVAEHYAGEITAPWRRAEKGIAELATIIRDREETSRPWAFVSLFQSGGKVQPVLDFTVGHESWNAAQVFIDGDEIDLHFHFHKESEQNGRYSRRFVLPETTLRTDAAFAENMVALRVRWPMPVWPVWSVASWTADPRILTHVRTFRERSIEVALQWWRQTPADETSGLVTDGAIWAERTDPNEMKLPPTWRIEKRTHG